MKKNKLNNGDRVVVKKIEVDDEIVELKVGMTGTVITSTDSIYVLVDDWNNGYGLPYECSNLTSDKKYKCDSSCWCLNEYQIELI